MSRTSTDPIPPPPTDPPVPLPQVPGPKLEPFTANAHADIEFLKFLGSPEDKDSKVWKVNIDGHGPYALKLFLFNSWESLQCHGNSLTKPLAKPKFYDGYFDPFNCECRVYGRLKQECREDLAVRSHGYLLLSPQQEHQVTNLMKSHSDGPIVSASDELDGYNFWGRFEEHRGHPIRAIVKEFASDGGEGFNSTQVEQLWEDVQDLHRLGILVRDITYANYIGGKLVDFSRAWTMYHPCFDWTTPRQLKSNLQQDAQRLIGLLYTWARVNREQHDAEGYDFEPPKGLKECSLAEDDCQDVDPGSYDWHKWEADPEATEAFIDKALF
ncbi:kinetochore Sim4 complex subunit FTA2-domain-containing protein [Cladorrhinum samala]|uniref:Kinetochore Sim4 complex subunit FTA2-domain-containing protein n=1 Tax=Cladorrhinum samala TaxID=585594 RepID=A0AAV9HN42_9PEZI|nr:kinetochore Sim4 complex subunit FTA2-domain-containing protein [Cladorrhinum samala]